jgi:hypothetical protein
LKLSEWDLIDHLSLSADNSLGSTSGLNRCTGDVTGESTPLMECDSQDQSNQSKPFGNACPVDLLDYLRTTP